MGDVSRARLRRQPPQPFPYSFRARLQKEEDMMDTTPLRDAYRALLDAAATVADSGDTSSVPPVGSRSVRNAALPPRWPAITPRRNAPNWPRRSAPPATSCPPQPSPEHPGRATGRTQTRYDNPAGYRDADRIRSTRAVIPHRRPGTPAVAGRLTGTQGGLRHTSGSRAANNAGSGSGGEADGVGGIGSGLG